MVRKRDLINTKPHNKEKWEIRICLTCRKEFEVYKSSNTKYCSKKCTGESYKKRITKICPTCGKTFEVIISRQQQKYCSFECRSKNPEYINNRENGRKEYLKTYTRKQITKICPVCGKTFYFSTHHYHPRVCCSRECANTLRKENKSSLEKNQITKYKIKIISKICLKCGKSFNSYIYQNKKYCPECGTSTTKICPVCGKSFKTERNGRHRKYCSIVCRKKYQKSQKHIKTCPTCGKIFELEYKSSKQKYCSIKCRSKNPEYKANLVLNNTRKGKHKLGWVPKICPTCGKNFDSYVDHPRTYCSRKCERIDAIITKICPICDKSFESYKCHDAKYCSIKCAKNDPEWLAKIMPILRNNTYKKPTRPQTILLLIIKYLYPNEAIVFENPVVGLRYSIDVAIPRLMLGFEYDEPKFHKNNPWKSRAEYDQKRHLEIESKGWNLIHYETQKELKDLIPSELWCKINMKIKRTTADERWGIIELCSHNTSFENILNTQFDLKYKHIRIQHNLIEHICPTCGKTFRSERYRHQIYCSYKCSGIGRSHSNKKHKKNIEKYLMCTDTISI